MFLLKSFCGCVIVSIAYKEYDGKSIFECVLLLTKITFDTVNGVYLQYGCTLFSLGS